LKHRNIIRTNTLATGLMLLAFGSLNVWTTTVFGQAPAAAATVGIQAATPVPAANLVPTTYVTTAPVQQPMQQIAAVAARDPYGFTAWLNSTRAQHGLGAVGYDPNLSAWCNVNNAQQASRGMGHFVMGPARRQNCAMGAYANIGAMWLNSPAHRAALLDPSITSIGIASWGAFWTFNAY
jgi:uncharacterized protein YkwD